LDYLTTHTSLSPIWGGFAPGFVNYKKGCIQLAAASDKVYQLLAHGQWFSEILLKVALNTINQINQINLFTFTGGNWIYSDHQITILIQFDIYKGGETGYIVIIKS